MAFIKISELRPAGSELFQDSESFLNELSENREVDQIFGGRRRGGFRSITANTAGNTVNASIGVSNNNDGNTIANTLANSLLNTF